MAMVVKLFEMNRLSSGLAAQMVDMDRVTFLLSLQHFKLAHKILQKLGYEVLSRECSDNSTGFDLTSGRVEYRKRFDNGLSLRLNVQPTLVARKWFFSETEPDIKTLFHRSLCIPGRTVRILGRDDFLFQLCVHNAAHGYVRKPGIRLHLDIDWYIRAVNKEMDGSAFILLAQHMRVTRLT